MYNKRFVEQFIRPKKYFYARNQYLTQDEAGRFFSKISDRRDDRAKLTLKDVDLERRPYPTKTSCLYSTKLLTRQ